MGTIGLPPYDPLGDIVPDPLLRFAAASSNFVGADIIRPWEYKKDRSRACVCDLLRRMKLHEAACCEHRNALDYKAFRKRERARLPAAYSPSITASIRMPMMMMKMKAYCFFVSFSFRKMRDRIRDTTHTAEMIGAAMAPLPLAMA